jgi:hypothetical protein
MAKDIPMPSLIESANDDVIALSDVLLSTTVLISVGACTDIGRSVPLICCDIVLRVAVFVEAELGCRLTLTDQ